MAFNEDLEIGKIAEEWTYRVLVKDNCVIDARMNPKAQVDDYDFLVRPYANILQAYKVEVKADQKISKSGNFFIETKATMKKDGSIKNGWFYYSKADFIYYHDVKNKLTYIFKLEDMKDYLHKNRCSKRSATDKNKIMEGYIVNVSKFANSYDCWVMDSEGNYL